MRSKSKRELYSSDLAENDPLEKMVDNLLKEMTLSKLDESLSADKVMASFPKRTDSPYSSIAATASPTTSPHKKNGLKNALGHISETIGDLAHMLHMSPFLFLLICVGALFFIICICCICCIRCMKKKMPKDIGNRVDVFDNIPLPDFTDEESSSGIITYSMLYDIKKNVFRVRLLDASGLHVVNNQPMDPYVCLSLVKPMTTEEISISDLEKVGKSYKTKVQMNTCNPVFNEVFNFKEPLGTVLQSWLFFNIIDYDTSGSDVNYGYVLIRLNERDSNAFVGDTIEETAAIIPSSMAIKTGDICVILKLTVLKEKEQLTMTLLEARDLPIPKTKGGSLFVSVTIYKEGKDKKWKKKISPRIPCTTPHPYFNAMFQFSVPYAYMKTGRLVIKIIHISATLGLRKIIGRLDFSTRSEDITAVNHWNDVARNPLKSVPRWHTLPRFISDD